MFAAFAFAFAFAFAIAAASHNNTADNCTVPLFFLAFSDLFYFFGGTSDERLSTQEPSKDSKP